MLAENVNRALAGYKEKRLVIRKWLLSLRCDCITMVQPAESRQGLNLAFTRRADFCRPTCWRVLPQLHFPSVCFWIPNTHVGLRGLGPGKRRGRRAHDSGQEKVDRSVHLAGHS